MTASELFEAILELSPAERERYLDEHCPDAGLRARVLAMVARTGDADKWFSAFEQSIGDLWPELPENPSLGKRIGAWQLIREIGRGGMATVYLAERADGQFGQRAAVKILQKHRESGDALRRFLAERQILSRLEHPGIARLLDGGETPDGSPFFVLEYVPGVPITEWCESRKLDVKARLQLVQQVASAVGYAHRNLIVHRDLKPSNILVNEEGDIKLLDFGIAKPLEREAGSDTQTVHRALSPDYAAPEQITGAPITTLTDVYGLGAVLYELLSGARPAVPLDRSWREIERAVLERDPEPVSQAGHKQFAAQLEGDLTAICRRALEKEPDRRYQSVTELSSDIDRWLEGRPVAARAGDRLYRAKKFILRHRMAVVATTLGLTLIAGFVVFLEIQSRRIAAERDKARYVADLFVNLFSFADPEEARGGEITAREVMDRSSDQLRGKFDGSPEVKATLLDVTARVYHKLGLYDRAAPLLQEALRVRQTSQAKSLPEIADNMHRLGMLYNDRGDYPNAENWFRQALELRRTAFGDRDSETARTMEFLALALLRRGKTADAEPLFRQALEIQRTVRPLHEADLAEAQVGLGMLLAGKGGERDAEPLLREALAIQRRVLGDKNRATGETLNNLATVTSRLGRSGEALELERQAISTLRAVYGNEHPRVATLLNNLALMYMASGRREKAEPLLREAIQIRRSRLKADHPDLAQSLGNLGLLLQENARLAEAESLHLEALAIRRKAFGEKHISLVQGLGSLGQLKQSQKQHTEAERYLRAALDMSKNTAGPQHPLTANCIQNLAAELAETKKPEAEATFREALTMRRKVLPPGHPHLAYTLVGLGRILGNSGRKQEARIFLAEAVEIRGKTLPPGNPLRVEAERELQNVQ